MIGANATNPRSVTGVPGFYRTSIGKKAVMAVTGFILYGFVLLHMVGNLKIFYGADYINDYSRFLREVFTPVFPHEGVLWLLRVVLAASVGLHLWSAISLTRTDLASRPVGYAKKKDQATSYASRTMRWGGVIIALFVIYHLLDLTLGTVNPGYVEGNVHRNMIASFSLWYVSAFYILAVVALGVHLFHGVWSMFQSIGWNGPGVDRIWRGLAAVTAAAFIIGNSSVPLAVLTGLVK